MKFSQLFALLLFCVTFITACDDEEPSIMLEVPTTYAFEREGTSTVSFTGQTDRLAMGNEIGDALKDFTKTEADLAAMYANAGPNGEDVAPYTQASLNESTKSVRGKTAASRDYFSTNTATAAEIRAEFDGWISGQVYEVFPAANVAAEPGQAGQIADGSAVRYVNAQGLEYDQLIIKGLIGALMTDQMLNNYLGTSVLDEASNVADNDAGTVADGKPYTTMEHKWDEAYGYLFGLSPDAASPLNTLGNDDDFLNKYLGRVENDEDYAGIAQRIFDAFKRGRAAIVAGEYEERDAQADIIREEVSKVIAIRAVYYLMQGKFNLEATPAAYGAAFHDLSEGYGFIYSLQFTRRPGTDAPYFSREEVATLLAELTTPTNGLWEVTPGTLESMANQITTRFGLSLDEAGS
ncbi:DUF4856 domain-containing protein [Lewinella sp. W8]|uniref:DUF4856 domain-containing protein n=1 Tax=Lewinella sp. W8 TaxID=2528208 RepID=UPI0010674C36|nr:DUF4856 domain-containing protein [Lewinella sp. W8]MTB50243.1 DUF4856 domain-containing protein [Lewinella sp. W8]